MDYYSAEDAFEDDESELPEDDGLDGMTPQQFYDTERPQMYDDVDIAGMNRAFGECDDEGDDE
jgi:hypothetical protein